MIGIGAYRAEISVVKISIEFHISIFTPGSSPGIFKEVVVCSIGVLIDSSYLNTMVEYIVGATVG